VIHVSLVSLFSIGTPISNSNTKMSTSASTIIVEETFTTLDDIDEIVPTTEVSTEVATFDVEVAVATASEEAASEASEFAANQPTAKSEAMTEAATDETLPGSNDKKRDSPEPLPDNEPDPKRVQVFATTQQQEQESTGTIPTQSQEASDAVEVAAIVPLDVTDAATASVPNEVLVEA
jgi:hypothetical protein